MQPKNLLFILSGEHQRDITGRCGNDPVETPHLDGVAQDGFRLALAYTPCPIRAQACASVAIEQWVLQVEAWDNAAPLCGVAPSWRCRLRAASHKVTSIGKLHFHNTDDENGFTDETPLLHKHNRMGNLIGDEVNATVFADQRAPIQRYGRREAVIVRRDHSYTPVPGEKPVLVLSA